MKFLLGSTSQMNTMFSWKILKKIRMIPEMDFDSKEKGLDLYAIF